MDNQEGIADDGGKGEEAREDEGYVDILPDDACAAILQFLQIKDVINVSMVSKKFKQIADGNIIWKELYQANRNFIGRNHPSQHMKLYREVYRQRLRDPQKEDKIEVQWHGKFRLQSVNHQFKGSSWWEATVVDKDKIKGYE